MQAERWQGLVVRRDAPQPQPTGRRQLLLATHPRPRFGSQNWNWHHSPTGGAFGAYMFGIGATEMAGVLATGTIWIKVPETILIRWHNQLSPFVTAKDMMLATCRKIGMGGGRYQAIQFAGESDIMPIFTDKFEELQSKGIQFPGQEQQFKSHKQI